MYAIIGIIVLIIMVFGGFMLSGGAMGPVLAAMPYEMLIIGGAAIGAMVAGNSLDGLKAIGAAFKKIFKGPQHNKQDHIDAIALTTQLMRMLKNDGPVALESHLDDPANSTVFSEYPNLLGNKALIALICDTLTLLVVSSGTLETHAVEEVMDNAMKTHFHEIHEPQHSLEKLSDALPALGIVAAVLGVVKTMGSIDEPPEVLGKMIGAALVGTFLGVLLAYGVVGPLAGRLKQVLEQDEQIFHAVKQVIIASLYGHPQPLVVESARSSLGHTVRPGLNELLDALRGR
ncbi:MULTISPECIES: flagellar motor stator protein MotA [unclassified Erythrobacter]|jgi:chemotaxis protein MotA|uniref:flagellar motor stator protein MotA n=1 Tax=Erythrobacteraceae TaxID=335929 RepID=UPI00076D23AF|nr:MULTISPECIES: flagellar motor stator protein MotA [unclassified Erythrobacter]KWV94120.1 flagellar motor stator protein MotA [Erythrobacter sp. AP23]MBO6527403.1 flagellar motor stator protein MotA [Erythrobacter sp.]MBO6530787.1 flagellar motor stator protein MotA [Erythrobacter sp.]MBO6769491.1 flagellar motor stator protein MotA [Erythrobacter sp.]